MYVQYLVCVYMYVLVLCVYKYVCVCVCVYVGVCACAWLCMCMYTRPYAHTRPRCGMLSAAHVRSVPCVCVCMYVLVMCVYKYVGVCVCVCMCVYVRVLGYVCVGIIGNAHILDVAAACCLPRVYAQYLVCVYTYIY